jgi:hypothetical protein
MAGERLFRCEVETHFQNVLVQNVFHCLSKIPEVYASQVAITLHQKLLRQIMRLQVYNVIYERFIVTCLEPLAPHMYVMDLENERPLTDVVALPLPISWKWTARNLTPLRYFIGGFYIGGLRSLDWTYNGQVSSTGVQEAIDVRDDIINAVGVGGSDVVTLGTFSRRYRQVFPQTALHDAFVPWKQLNFNSYYTSMRKRSPGVGR